MKKVNTRSMTQAEKHVLMASLCYNLKKLMKFKPKKPESPEISMQNAKSGVEKLFIEVLNFYMIIFGLHKPSLS